MKEGNVFHIEHVTQDELYVALRDIDDNKSSGCDGLSALFIKRTWSVIGKDVTETITFFRTNELYSTALSPLLP